MHFCILGTCIYAMDGSVFYKVGVSNGTKYGKPIRDGYSIWCLVCIRYDMVLYMA